MKVEFHRADDPDEVVATAVWEDGRVEVHSDDATVSAQLNNAYRRTPVVTDDASYRRMGTHGEVVIQPGDLEWFRAVSQVRAPTLSGLVARLVPGISEGGFDPAAGYRRFEAAVERLSSGEPGDGSRS
jgi:hypothetical protein